MRAAPVHPEDNSQTSARTCTTTCTMWWSARANSGQAALALVAFTISVQRQRPGTAPQTRNGAARTEGDDGPEDVEPQKRAQRPACERLAAAAESEVGRVTLVLFAARPPDAGGCAGAGAPAGEWTLLRELAASARTVTGEPCDLQDRVGCGLRVRERAGTSHRRPRWRRRCSPR